MSKIYIVTYHYTRDLRNSRYPDIKGLDYKLFDQQLAFFKENFNVIRMERLIEALNTGDAGAVIPDNALLLTFDDGYIDHYTVAFPLLKKYEMQGSFFVHSDVLSNNIALDANKLQFVLASGADISEIKNSLLKEVDQFRSEKPDLASNAELIEKYAIPNRWDTAEVMFVKRMLQTVLPQELRRIICERLFKEYVGIDETIFSKELYMNMDQIRIMHSDGMHIGIHGDGNTLLGEMNTESVKESIDHALMFLGEVVSPSSWSLSYHDGKNNTDKIIEYVKSKGCAIGFTTDWGLADIGKDAGLLLPRLDCNDFPPKSDSYKRVFTCRGRDA